MAVGQAPKGLRPWVAALAALALLACAAAAGAKQQQLAAHPAAHGARDPPGAWGLWPLSWWPLSGHRAVAPAAHRPGPGRLPALALTLRLRVDFPGRAWLHRGLQVPSGLTLISVRALGQPDPAGVRTPGRGGPRQLLRLHASEAWADPQQQEHRRRAAGASAASLEASELRASGGFEELEVVLEGAGLSGDEWLEAVASLLGWRAAEAAMEALAALDAGEMDVDRGFAALRLLGREQAERPRYLEAALAAAAGEGEAEEEEESVVVESRWEVVRRPASRCRPRDVLALAGACSLAAAAALLLSMLEPLTRRHRRQQQQQEQQQSRPGPPGSLREPLLLKVVLEEEPGAAAR